MTEIPQQSRFCFLCLIIDLAEDEIYFSEENIFIHLLIAIQVKERKLYRSLNFVCQSITIEQKHVSNNSEDITNQPQNDWWPSFGQTHRAVSGHPQ